VGQYYIQRVHGRAVIYILKLLTIWAIHCKQNLQDSWICFDQIFLGLGLGKLFLARESLVSYIPAGDGNLLNLFLRFTIYLQVPCEMITIFSGS